MTGVISKLKLALIFGQNTIQMYNSSSDNFEDVANLVHTTTHHFKADSKCVTVRDQSRLQHLALKQRKNVTVCTPAFEGNFCSASRTCNIKFEKDTFSAKLF